MQTLITEAAAYSPAGMSDLSFISELMMATTILRELTSRTPAGFSSDDIGTGISTSLAKDDDDIEEEDDDDEDDLDDDDDEDDDLDEEDDDELDDEEDEEDEDEEP